MTEKVQKVPGIHQRKIIIYVLAECNLRYLNDTQLVRAAAGETMLRYLSREKTALELEDVFGLNLLLLWQGSIGLVKCSL